MLQETAIAVRKYSPEDRPNSDNEPQTYFIFLNGKSFLMCTPWSRDWENVTLAWDGRIETSELEKEISDNLPAALGLNLTPPELLRSTSVISQVAEALDLSTMEGLQAFRRRVIETPDEHLLINVGRGESGPTSMIREWYSLVMCALGEDNPVNYAFKNEGFPKKYSGREIELLVKGSDISAAVVLWIAQHHMDPVGLSAVDKITEAIRQIKGN